MNNSASGTKCNHRTYTLSMQFHKHFSIQHIKQLFILFQLILSLYNGASIAHLCTLPIKCYCLLHQNIFFLWILLSNYTIFKMPFQRFDLKNFTQQSFKRKKTILIWQMVEWKFWEQCCSHRLLVLYEYATMFSFVYYISLDPLIVLVVYDTLWHLPLHTHTHTCTALRLSSSHWTKIHLVLCSLYCHLSICVSEKKSWFSYFYFPSAI